MDEFNLAKLDSYDLFNLRIGLSWENLMAELFVANLTDEEAFRLSDIENRDREDISDYERATDYADALGRYYENRQNAMAERLEVSEAWLSRYLLLAKTPKPDVSTPMVNSFALTRVTV